MLIKNLSTIYVCKKCKKEYKYIQSLHRHSNKCIFEDNENKYDIISSIRSNEDDLCILIADGDIKGRDIEIAQEMPEIGDHVYNISAPRSMHGPNMALMFDGYYQGHVQIPEEIGVEL